jgi:hypothetical protein
MRRLEILHKSSEEELDLDEKLVEKKRRKQKKREITL